MELLVVFIAHSTLNSVMPKIKLLQHIIFLFFLHEDISCESIEPKQPCNLNFPIAVFLFCHDV